MSRRSAAHAALVGVHRVVGLADDAVVGLLRVRTAGHRTDADADAQADGLAGDLQRLGDRTAEAVGQLLRVTGLGVLADDAELVAAQPGGGVARAQDRPQPVGDAVLIAFAERLTSVLRASDTAARVGGDEFSVVCENSGRADAEALAARLRERVGEPLRLSGGLVLPLSLSIGIGTVEGGTDPERAFGALVREADDAMYVDKAARRG